ncbi:hypothetical protein AcW1_005669 [Taiwanofungus camphoratus]|nr:hypothetical protein AcW2_004433 [Antrodia cinnamomea]KAI0957200.1 hypothetical protein AcW1_005669 [Antrodia cinnamomea]
MTPKGKEARAESRQVNNLLHTLRGEQFRQERNRSKAYLSHAASHIQHNSTLPFSQIYDYAYARRDAEQVSRDQNFPSPVRLGSQGILEYAYPRGAVPGPPPPKSWSGLYGKGKDKKVDDLAQRAEALSLIFSHLPWSARSGWAQAECLRLSSVPPLTQLCLRVLLSVYSAPDNTVAFSEELVRYLPAHLRREAMRWTAVNSPLSSSKLYALCERDGHVDGELIVVGPETSLPRDYLKTAGLEYMVNANGRLDGCRRNDNEEHEEWSWDSPAANACIPSPLHTLILLATPLPVSTFLTFPPTLTHVALLALPAPTPIYRLPRLCPLVEVLDLSFNPWLNDTSGTIQGETVLERVEWTRWGRLKVLGLRNCGVKPEIVGRINEGRWVDVETVGAG